MYTPPDTVCQLAHIDYQDRLRVAARGYLAAQADAGAQGGRRRAMRAALAAALMAASQRLRGVPVPVLTPAAAGER